MPEAVAAPHPSESAGAYREYAPPAALAAYVECFWSRGGSPGVAPRRHRVLPDGCADVLFAFDTGGAGPVGIAVGAMTRPVVFVDGGHTDYVGVRFRPGAAGAIFGLPASDLTDGRPDLADVWRGAEPLHERLTLAADTSARVKLLTAEVARRALGGGGAPRLVVVAAERILASRGRVSIRALASDLGVTRQHLARAFARHVGLSPKMLARITRARGVVDHVRVATDFRHGLASRRPSGVDWTAIALDAGYYDQSHLIAEVKQLTGLTPSAWLNVGS